MSSLRSDNVWGLLQLFFCFVLLATGSCLECETCESNSTSCTGPKENCTNGDICVTTTERSCQTIGGCAVRVVKSCGVAADVCDVTQMHFDLGNGVVYQMQHYCCTEDCSQITAALPELEKDPQGRRCPACNSLGEPCKKETVEYSGKDTDCFIITMNVTSDGKRSTHTMKGCGSKNICSMFQNDEQPIVVQGEPEGKIKCVFSSSASRILASLLTTFYSLWILKLLV